MTYDFQSDSDCLDALHEIDDADFSVSEWESTFIDSMFRNAVELGQSFVLSDGQRAKVREIWEKYADRL